MSAAVEVLDKLGKSWSPRKLSSLDKMQNKKLIERARTGE